MNKNESLRSRTPLNSPVNVNNIDEKYQEEDRAVSVLAGHRIINSEYSTKRRDSVDFTLDDEEVSKVNITLRIGSPRPSRVKSINWKGDEISPAKKVTYAAKQWMESKDDG